MADDTKADKGAVADPSAAARSSAKRKFEVAEGHGLFVPGRTKKATGGDVVELTAAELKLFPKGSLLPYVEDEEDAA